MSRRFRFALTALTAGALALGVAGAAAADPAIHIEPAAGADFGTHFIGDKVVGEAAVVNDGPDEATIGAASVTGDPSFSVKLDDCEGVVLAADEYCVIDVRFEPATVGAVQAQLSVPSTAPDSPHQLVLKGAGKLLPKGPPPLILDSFTATPAALDFGTLTIGGPAGTATVTAQTTGSLARLLTGIDGPDAASFDVQQTCVPAGVGHTCTLTVTFTPVHAGINQASLTLSGGGTRQVALTGIGVEPPGPPSRKALAAALGKPVGRWADLGRKAIRRAGQFALTAPRSEVRGKVKLEVRTADRRKRLVASGVVRAAPTGPKTLKAKLTRKGKALLGEEGKRKLNAILTFTTGDGSVVKAARSFTLPG